VCTREEDGRYGKNVRIPVISEPKYHSQAPMHATVIVVVTVMAISPDISVSTRSRFSVPPFERSTRDVRSKIFLSLRSLLLFLRFLSLFSYLQRHAGNMEPRAQKSAKKPAVIFRHEYE